MTALISAAVKGLSEIDLKISALERSMVEIPFPASSGACPAVDGPDDAEPAGRSRWWLLLH
jgi:hypothetical protein